MMLKKWMIVLLATVMLGLTGCNSTEKTPDGVFEAKSGTWYIVKLPDGSKVDDYFTLTGSMGNVHMTNMGQMNQNVPMGMASYAQAKEGGWVIYGGGLFLYIPYEATEETARTACNTLILNSDNYMSFEDAKEYIPFLK